MFPEIHTQYQKKALTYQLNRMIEMKIPDSLMVFDYLHEYTETAQEYLLKYSEVVELRLKGTSLRKISETTGISYGTVAKVCTVLKYEDQTDQPNPYLLKHSDIVTQLLKGLNQREVAEKTGASLATVNTVAKITEINYIQLNRENGKVTMAKYKERTKNNELILDFIRKNYCNWEKTLQGNESDEVIIREYNKYLKTIPIPSTFDIDQYKKINDSFTNDILCEIHESRSFKKERELSRERVREKQEKNKEYHRLRKIKQDEFKEEIKILRAKSAKELKINEQKRLEQRKRDKIKWDNDDRNNFNKLLNAGINPWSNEWDKCPEKYYDVSYKGNFISEFWEEDQDMILSLRKKFPDQEQFVKDNLEEFNKELAEELLASRRYLNHLDVRR